MGVEPSIASKLESDSMAVFTILTASKLDHPITHMLTQ